MLKFLCEGSKVVISFPLTKILPESSFSSPAIIRSKVVLPQPLGPRKHINSPFSISRSMPFRTSTLLNCFFTFL